MSKGTHTGSIQAPCALDNGIHQVLCAELQGAVVATCATTFAPRPCTKNLDVWKAKSCERDWLDPFGTSKAAHPTCLPATTSSLHHHTTTTTIFTSYLLARQKDSLLLFARHSTLSLRESPSKLSPPRRSGFCSKAMSCAQEYGLVGGFQIHMRRGTLEDFRHGVSRLSTSLPHC